MVGTGCTEISTYVAGVGVGDGDADPDGLGDPDPDGPELGGGEPDGPGVGLGEWDGPTVGLGDGRPDGEDVGRGEGDRHGLWDARNDDDGLGLCLGAAVEDGAGVPRLRAGVGLGSGDDDDRAGSSCGVVGLAAGARGSTDPVSRAWGLRDIVGEAVADGRGVVGGALAAGGHPEGDGRGTLRKVPTRQVCHPLPAHARSGRSR